MIMGTEMNSDTSLIEAVAKAICQSAIDENDVAVNGVSFGRTLDGGDQPLWRNFTTDAEAVLTAIEAAGFRLVQR